MTEHQTQQEILLAMGRGSRRLWRNNTGCLPDANGRPVRFGLCCSSAPASQHPSWKVTDRLGIRQRYDHA